MLRRHRRILVRGEQTLSRLEHFEGRVRGDRPARAIQRRQTGGPATPLPKRSWLCFQSSNDSAQRHEQWPNRWLQQRVTHPDISLSNSASAVGVKMYFIRYR